MSSVFQCVVCLGARATMQTFPCEHRVVCRKCFIRTIQVAVAQRSLPLRCVVCRTRILKLRHCSPGSKAVSVNAESPFQSSSAPRTKHKLSHNGNGFIVNNNNNNAAISNNNNNTTIVNNNKIHAVTSLGKVSPCRPAGQGNRKGMKPSSSSLFAPEPPRVTLTKAAPSHFSPLAKSSHPNQRDASPSVTLTSTTAKMTTTATTTTTTTTSIRAAPATKQATPGKKGDVIVDTTLAVSKGNNSHSSRRGRVFPFRSLFSRQ